MCNDTYSLIDHILCNDNSNKIYSGSIVDDLSDHFMTFIQPDLCPNSKKPNKKQSNIKRRLVTNENLTNLQNGLKNLHWDEVLATDNVDDWCNCFWSTF
jgi:hypothetical protein